MGAPGVTLLHTHYLLLLQADEENAQAIATATDKEDPSANDKRGAQA